MSKAPGGAEKPAEKSVEGKPEGKKEDHGKGGGTHGAPSAEGKKTTSKGHNPAPGGCHAWGCKSPEKRFNFCDEHYDHFKFGLIKKTGEPVSDYDKKFEHYQAYKAKVGAHRVA